MMPPTAHQSVVPVLTVYVNDLLGVVSDNDMCGLFEDLGFDMVATLRPLLLVVPLDPLSNDESL